MSTDDDPFNDRYRDEDNFDEQFDSRERPRKTKQGMSTGMKVLIVLLCFGGGMIVLCCGVGVYFFSKASSRLTEDPREVVAITQDIVDIEIPVQFAPQSGMDLDIIFMQMKIVSYTSMGANGLLWIMEMKVSGLTPEQQEPEMREAMQGQDFGEMKLNVKKSESRTFTIRGKEIDFQFAEAENSRGDAYRQVTGVFPGKEGTAFLMLQIEEEGYDEDAVVKMIESIK